MVSVPLINSPLEVQVSVTWIVLDLAVIGVAFPSFSSVHCLYWAPSKIIPEEFAAQFTTVSGASINPLQVLEDSPTVHWIYLISSPAELTKYPAEDSSIVQPEDDPPEIVHLYK